MLVEDGEEGRVRHLAHSRHTHTHKAPRYWHVRLESERLKQKGKKNVTKNIT